MIIMGIVSLTTLCSGSVDFLALNGSIKYFISLSNYLTVIVPDEGYSRSVTCAQNYISTFLTFFCRKRSNLHVRALEIDRKQSVFEISNRKGLFFFIFR